jgi:uncharacterized protein (DUF58 family)
LEKRWLVWLLPFLFLLQVLIPSRVWIALLITWGGLLGLGYLWARRVAGSLSVSRQQRYGWVHVGDLLEETFELENRSFLPLLWIEIVDHSDLPGYTAQTVRSADPNQAIRWRTDGICRQRGLFTLGPWQVLLADPFGCYSVTLSYPDTQSVLVYPPVVHLPALQLPRGAAIGAGRTSRATSEATVNASAVRAYVPGDSQSRIHWRSSARTNELMVKTFDLEPSGDIWLVLDLNAAVQVGEGEESTEEYAVILASSLADRMLRQHRAVGLGAYGGAGSEPRPIIVLPDRGKAQQWRILRELATVRAGGAWPLARVLAEMDRNLGRGTTLAVITPSCNPDWLAGLLPPMRRGIAPAVLLLDPVSFGGSGNAEAMLGLLADLGVPGHRIEKGMPFRPVVKHQPTGRPEYKVLSGTGRVIVVER